MTAEILDACCGGRMWWWDKAHPLALYMDNRQAPHGSRADRPNWSCAPDVVEDFRSMPFEDDSFHLVVFDPPHISRPGQASGNVALQYGTLPYGAEGVTLKRGLAECWRVLAPGGSLIFKWAGKAETAKSAFPTEPIVGTRSFRKSSGLGTRWFVFYKQIEPVSIGDKEGNKK